MGLCKKQQYAKVRNRFTEKIEYLVEFSSYARYNMYGKHIQMYEKHKK